VREEKRREERKKYHTDLSGYGWYDCEKYLCVSVGRDSDKGDAIVFPMLWFVIDALLHE